MQRVFQEHGRLVYTLCLRALAHPQDAEDATQQVFLRAWRSRLTYDPDRPLGGWLTGITRRVILDVYTARDGHRRSAEAAQGRERLQATSSLDQTVVDRVAVTAALEQLGHPQQDVLRMAFVEDRPQAEIARRLDLPLGTVKSHIHRGLAALRGVLEVNGGAPCAE